MELFLLSQTWCINPKTYDDCICFTTLKIFLKTDDDCIFVFVTKLWRYFSEGIAKSKCLCAGLSSTPRESLAGMSQCLFVWKVPLYFSGMSQCLFVWKLQRSNPAVSTPTQHFCTHWVEKRSKIFQNGYDHHSRTVDYKIQLYLNSILNNVVENNRFCLKNYPYINSEEFHGFAHFDLSCRIIVINVSLYSLRSWQSHHKFW